MTRDGIKLFGRMGVYALVLSAGIYLFARIGLHNALLCISFLVFSGFVWYSFSK